MRVAGPIMKWAVVTTVLDALVACGSRTGLDVDTRGPQGPSPIVIDATVEQDAEHHDGNGVSLMRTVVAIMATYLALVVLNACGSTIQQLSDGGSDASSGQGGTDATVAADTGEVDVRSDTGDAGGTADATAFRRSDAGSDSDAGGDQLDGSSDVAAMAPPDADSMTCSMADGPCGQASEYACCAGHSLLCMGNGTCNVLGGH